MSIALKIVPLSVCRWLPPFLLALLLPLSAGADTPARERERVIQGLGQSVDESAANYMRGTPADQLPDIAGEIAEVRIAQQYGLGYLPLMVARQLNLIQKHARLQGQPNLKVVWSRYPSGAAMNSALLSGFLDIASGGIAPMIKAWDETRFNKDIIGFTALSSMPLYLNTINPQVRSLEDIGPGDRIALPVRLGSLQAILLQMAIARDFGIEHHKALDHITVSMKHPDAMESLLEGANGITAHFASPPFQYQELDDPRVRLARRVRQRYTWDAIFRIDIEPLLHNSGDAA